MHDTVIGVDIGGTNIRVGLVNGNLELTRKEVALTGNFESADELFTAIRKMMESVDPERKASKVGIAMPAPWKKDTEYVVDAVNIPYMENMSIRTIQAYFPDHEVYFENDVNVIALLESDEGASKGYSNSMYITVSTGIGSGIILNNEILHGAHGYAGEIGSMIISDINNHHASLYSGSLESLCSGVALEEESKKLYGTDATAQTLFERYHQQDPQAVEVIHRWIELFSRAIASLMQTMDPDVFVLGGSVITNNSWLIDKVIENAKSKVLGNLRNEIRIVSPVFGMDAGIIGAGYTALKQSKQFVGR